MSNRKKRRNPRPARKTPWEKWKLRTRAKLTSPAARLCYLILAAAVVVVLAVILIVHLLDDTHVFVRTEDGDLKDSQSGIVYHAAPAVYEALEQGEAFGIYKKHGLSLYEVKQQEPTAFLSLLYTENTTGTLFYADGVTLPALDAFGTEEIRFYRSDITSVSRYTLTDPDAIDAILDAFLNGTVTEPAVGQSPNVVYRLSFCSPAYPGISYNLTYTEYGDTHLLYDRSTKHCVDVGDLLTPYLDTDTDETGEVTDAAA